MPQDKSHAEWHEQGSLHRIVPCRASHASHASTAETCASVSKPFASSAPRMHRSSMTRMTSRCARFARALQKVQRRAGAVRMPNGCRAARKRCASCACRR